MLITGYWLLLLLFVAMSLATTLPEEFMKPDYTGPFTKPHRAAQIAFLTFAGTVMATFLIWIITSRISYYYDYLLTSTLTLFAGWWFIALALGTILRSTTKKEAGIRWLIGIILVAIVGLGFFAPAMKSIATDLLTKPQPITETVTAKSYSVSKYGATYRAYLNDAKYNITRGAYSELDIGETAVFAHANYHNMAFPADHVKISWLGVILLILNVLIFSGAMMVIGYGFFAKT